jgi:hypothetical protein
MIVKTLLLSLLFHGLSADPAPRRVDRLRRAVVLPVALVRSTPPSPFVAEVMRA